MKTLFAVVTLFILFGIVAPARAQYAEYPGAYTIVDLGVNVFPTAINSKGDVAGYVSAKVSGTYYYHPFVWYYNSQTFVDLASGQATSYGVEVMGIDNSDDVALQYGTQAYLIPGGGSVSDATPLDNFSDVLGETFVYGMGGDGEMAGSVLVNSGNYLEAATWDAGPLPDAIAPLNASDPAGQGRGVSAGGGEIVGNMVNAGGTSDMFISSGGGGAIDTGVPSGQYEAINDSDNILLWQGAYQYAGDPFNPTSLGYQDPVYGINNFGQIVGNAQAGPAETWVPQEDGNWTSSVLYDQLAGGNASLWQALYYANAINDNGVICGAGEYEDSTSHGFVLIPSGGLKSVSVSQGTLHPSKTATGTVTLLGPAPSGGVDVSLTATGNAISIPTSVEIQGGATSATFQVMSNAVTKSSNSTITAQADNQAVSTTVTVRPLDNIEITVSPLKVDASETRGSCYATVQLYQDDLSPWPTQSVTVAVTGGTNTTLGTLTSHTKQTSVTVTTDGNGRATVQVFPGDIVGTATLTATGPSSGGGAPTDTATLTLSNAYGNLPYPLTAEDLVPKPGESNIQVIERVLGKVIPDGPFAHSAFALDVANAVPKGMVQNLYQFATQDNQFNGKFVCGGYQGQVLTALNELRYNPLSSSLFDGIDYSPVQAYQNSTGSLAGHYAVVMYPSGTDYTQTGTVIDPWLTQTYTLYDWQDWYDIALQAAGPDISTKRDQYPLTNVDNVPASQLYPPPGLVQQVPNPARPEDPPLDPVTYSVNVLVNGPAAASVTDQATGLSSGFSSSQAVTMNTPDVFMYDLADTQGAYHQLFDLLDRDYTLTLTGTGSGTVSLIMSSVDSKPGNLAIYKNIPITTGQTLTMTVGPETVGQPLSLSSGTTVAPSTTSTGSTAPAYPLQPVVGSAINADGLITATLGGLRFNHANNQWIQTVTVTSSITTTQPVYLTLDGLPSGAFVTSSNGIIGYTNKTYPRGNAAFAVDLLGMTAGQSITMTLTFANEPTDYYPVILVGPNY